MKPPILYIFDEILRKLRPSKFAAPVLPIVAAIRIAIALDKITKLMFGQEYQDDIALLVGSLKNYKDAINNLADEKKYLFLIGIFTDNDSKLKKVSLITQGFICFCFLLFTLLESSPFTKMPSVEKDGRFD